MVFVILLLVLAGYFCLVGITAQAYTPAQRTAKLTKPLSKLIHIAPLLGTVVFTALFLFVFRDLLLERISHAILVFGLWVYAVQFYQYALSYLHKKKLFFGSMAGMVACAALAIVLTPLGRYVPFFYSFLHLGSLFFACGFLLLLYTVKFVLYRKSKTKRTEGNLKGN